MSDERETGGESPREFTAQKPVTEATRQLRHVVILEKGGPGGVLAALGYAEVEGGARAGRFDPRLQPQVMIGPVQDVGKVKGSFRWSVRESVKNGWQKIYAGPPLIG